MKELLTVYEDREELHLSCEDIEGLDKYLQGRDILFNYEIIKKVDNKIIISKEDYPNYDRFRVVYTKKSIDKEEVIYFTNDVKKRAANSYSNEEIEIRIIESYKGISLSFQTKEIYNKYSLYEKTKTGYKMILETELFQVTTNSVKKDKTYMVLAYKKEEDKFVLANRSKDFKITFEKFNKKRKNSLTVVIPVFNGEFFLPRTLDSVLLSRFQDFDVILVNDGSKDKTLEVFKWYEDKYPFIKGIDKKWSGPSMTRNVGIEVASGEYIGVIDSDDLVHPYMYELLVKNALKEDADIAISKTIIYEDDSDIKYVLNVDCKDNEYIKYDYDKMFDDCRKNTYENAYFVSVCNKIVKKELTRKAKFPISNFYEDYAYTSQLYSFANNFILVGDAYYIWDKRKRGTFGTLSTSYVGNNVNLIEEYVKSLSYALKEGNKERSEYLVYYAVHYLNDYFKVIKSNEVTVLKYMEYIDRNIGKKLILENKYIKEEKEKYKEFLEKLSK